MRSNSNPSEQKSDIFSPNAHQALRETLRPLLRKIAVENINAIDLKLLSVDQCERLMTRMNHCLDESSVNLVPITRFINTELPELKECLRLASEAKTLLKELEPYEPNSALVDRFNGLFFSSSLPKLSEVSSLHQELLERSNSLGLEEEKIAVLKKKVAQKYKDFLLNIRDSNLKLKNFPQATYSYYENIVSDYQMLLQEKSQVKLEKCVPIFNRDIDQCYGQMKKIHLNYRIISQAEQLLERLKLLDKKHDYSHCAEHINGFKQGVGCDQTFGMVKQYIDILEKMIRPLELREEGKNLIEELVKFESDEAGRIQARASYQRSLDEAYATYNEDDNPNSLDVFVKNLEKTLQKEKTKLAMGILSIREYARDHIKRTVAHLPETEREKARLMYQGQLNLTPNTELDLFAFVAQLKADANGLKAEARESEQKIADDLVSQKNQLQRDIVPIDGSIQTAMNDLVALELLEKNKYRTQLEKRHCIATEKANETVSLQPLENFLTELTAELSATQERTRKLEELGLVTTLHIRRVDEETKQTPAPAASGNKFFASVAGLFKKNPAARAAEAAAKSAEAAAKSAAAAAKSAAAAADAAKRGEEAAESLTLVQPKSVGVASRYSVN